MAHLNAKIAKMARRSRPRHGTATLRNTAMRAVCQSIDSLDEGYLDFLPPRVGRELWEMIVKKQENLLSLVF